MKFCLEDGTLLQPATIVSDPNATLVLPVAHRGAAPPTAHSAQRPTQIDRPLLTQTDQVVSPSFQSAPARKSPLPWILGIAVVLGASGIVIALILVRALLPTNRPADQAVTATSSPTPVGPMTAQSPASTPPDTSEFPRQASANSSPSRPQANKATAETTPTQPATQKATPTPKPASTTETATGAKQRTTIQGGVMNGKAVHLVQPVYPQIAKQAHASGTVIVQVLIDEQGNVISAHALSGHPLLQAPALAAARGSKFEATTLSGQPVRVTGVIHYNFVAQ